MALSLGSWEGAVVGALAGAIAPALVDAVSEVRTKSGAIEQEETSATQVSLEQKIQLLLSCN